jgi:hypothetical protein
MAIADKILLLLNTDEGARKRMAKLLKQAVGKAPRCVCCNCGNEFLAAATHGRYACYECRPGRGKGFAR